MLRSAGPGGPVRRWLLPAVVAVALVVPLVVVLHGTTATTATPATAGGTATASSAPGTGAAASAGAATSPSSGGGFLTGSPAGAPAGSSAGGRSSAPANPEDGTTSTDPAAADHPPRTLTPVSLQQTAAVPGDVTVQLTGVTRTAGQGVGPGNVSGPALRVAVRITDRSGSPVDLGGAVVNLYLGPDRNPASPLDDPSRRPFSGRLAAGASGDGVYVFSTGDPVPSPVTVEVGYRPGAPLALFVGPVG